MKKLSVLVLIFAINIVGFNAVKAQGVSSGIKGGLTLSNLYIDEDNLDEENARIGFNVGIYSQMMFSEIVGMQVELLYTTKGTEATYTGVLNQTIDFRLAYIDLPVLLVLRPAEMFEIHAGPYIGYLIQSEVDFTGTIDGITDIDRDHFNSFDYGVAAGIAFNFQSVKIGFRYNLGLQELADSNTASILLGDSKNSYAQVYIGLNLAY